MGIESLAGTYHPHAIEVQDFAGYGLVIDLRTAAEYADDHIPGAVHVAAPEVVAVPGQVGSVGEPVATPLWPALAAAVAGVRLDQALLVYCGQGGLVSTPVAKSLRWRGWATDVLPGGWVNYRRWVLAGLEVLPRLLAFRVVSCTLGTEAARVLNALHGAGQQVLDLEMLAASRRFVFTPGPSVPSQAWFDSQLLQALRGFDPTRPVWVAELGPRVGAITLPGALVDALGIAPMAALQAPAGERVAAWMTDEPLCADAEALMAAVTSVRPAPSDTHVASWRELAARNATRLLLESILGGFLDPAYDADRDARSTRRHALAPIATDSLAPGPLGSAVAILTAEPST